MISLARRCVLGVFRAAVLYTCDNIKNKRSRVSLALKDFIHKNFTSVGWVILLLIGLLSGAKPSNDITGLSLILS